ncbi:MAG TPA: GLUG motif-containing protein, partial [Fibrobacteraceae bacterium]|nr:GLUG motif-containing protein [Fibrobacteraceae bacterium]
MKVLPLPILLVGLISLSLGQTATAPEGSGTTNSPYQIASLENLYWLSQNQNAWADTFVQTADIDASPTASWDNDSGFMPIVLFTGAYDGQGYSISGLQIHRNSRDCVGLFGTTNDATIQNVVLTDASISGFFSVGSLIGFMKGGTLETSSATGTVSGLSGAAGGLTGYVNGNVRIDNSYAEVSVSTDSGSIGGLVGSAISTDTIENSYATGNVQGCAGNAGGLVGFANSIEIIGCYATGLVSGDSANVGGLVGYAISTTINGAFASGSVTGSTNVGGLVGYLVSDTITESYASGTVTGGSNVGGLVGFLSISGIRSSYAIGDVSGTTANIGGLVGKSNVVSLQNSYAAGLVSGDGTDLSGFVGYTDSVSDFAGATACFWDTTATGQISSKAGNAKSMEEMRTQSTYTDSGWDFTNTWAISSNANQGYPYLQRWDLSRKAYAPSIRTLSTSSVTASSVTLEENLDWLGALPATAYGFCWNTTGSPTLADSVINLGTTTDTGTYSTTLTNLSAAIKYHVRAYAVNDSGTDYGSEITVQTPCDLDTNSSGEFLVADYADLKQVASGLLCSDTAIYRLTADIDASATAIENNGEGFTSIPTFQGKLHGAGHAIQ